MEVLREKRNEGKESKTKFDADVIVVLCHYSYRKVYQIQFFICNLLLVANRTVMPYN